MSPKQAPALNQPVAALGPSIGDEEQGVFASHPAADQLAQRPLFRRSQDGGRAHQTTFARGDQCRQEKDKRTRISLSKMEKPLDYRCPFSFSVFLFSGFCGKIEFCRGGFHLFVSAYLRFKIDFFDFPLDFFDTGVLFIADCRARLSHGLLER